MDFFDLQEHARRRSRWLYAWLSVALSATVAAFYAVAGAVRLAFGAPFWSPTLFTTISVFVVSILGIEILCKLSLLRAGGSAVAEGLGGRRLDRASADEAERRLLDVVEEMAVAAALPSPSVWVLDREWGINAFAAGNSPDDAALGLTRGAVYLLSRDEMQGVVAHEMSHVRSGDMRLNLRLMALLAGLLLFAEAGYRWTGLDAFDEDEAEGNPLGPPLLVVGYAGLVAATLIQRGISRQREMLADAAAVELTRNPLGLASALRKIGGLGHGSQVRHHQALIAAHLFFASSARHRFARVASTHPPLEERIRRLDPSFDGTFPAVDVTAVPPRTWIPPLPAPVAESEKPATVSYTARPEDE